MIKESFTKLLKLTTMFEIFLYLVIFVVIFWLLSKPGTPIYTTIEKLNSNEEVSSSTDEIERLDIHSSLPITPALDQVELSDISCYYSWVRSRKIAQENFCRLDNFRLSHRSYA